MTNQDNNKQCNGCLLARRKLSQAIQDKNISKSVKIINFASKKIAKKVRHRLKVRR